jgi:hypothetical protein
LRNFRECFDHLGNDEESAAECIHCLKKHGEQVFYSKEKKRLVLGREGYDPTVSEYMEKISTLLEIRTRKDYEKADDTYNLTMY